MRTMAIVGMLVLAASAFSQDRARDSFEFDINGDGVKEIIPGNAGRLNVAQGTLTATSDDVLDTKAVTEEIQIMAKVLEESINNAEIENWKAVLPYGTLAALDSAATGKSHIRSRYIPTVGIVFTVPVAFPLRSTASYSEGGDETEANESDLWNKHSRSSANYKVRFRNVQRNVGEHGTTIVTKEPVVIESKTSTVEKGKSKVLSTEALRIAAATARPDGTVGYKVSSGGGGGGLGGDDRVFGIGGGGAGGSGFAFNIALPEYDEAKVKKLRATLLDTVARYGHRMEHLPADERVIVIVESGFAELFGGYSFLEDIPVIGVKHEGKITSPSEVMRRGRSTARYQISVKKRDLTDSTTGDTLRGKVEETEY